MYRKNTLAIRLLAIALIVALALPLGANAAVAETVQPCASDYLSSYNAYVSVAGSGKIEVYYSVSGTGYIDSIGVKSIAIYESTNNSSWTWKKTFTSSSTPSMMSYNDCYHSGHVTYQGVAGRYYKAYVNIWGGDNGAGDNRYIWTSVKQAT